MTLTVDDLGIVRAALFEARTKWYDIGLALKVPVPTLDSIDSQFDNHSDKLREALKVWLKTVTEPSWQDIVDVLKSPVVSEPKLACDIKAKHCTIAAIGQASEQMMLPGVQQPQLTIADAQLQTLQMLLQDSRELRIKDQQLQDSQRHIHTLQQELQASQRQIEGLTQQVEEKNRQLEIIEQDLLQHEQTIGDLQLANDRLKRQLKQAQQQLKESQHVTEEKTIRDMRWQKESKAPEKMCRGSAASDSNVAYFNGTGSTTVHSYDSNTQEWHRLPDTPHTHFTLVVVQHMLTTVGGALRPYEATNSLLSLTGEGKNNKWLPDLPAMPTKRYWTAAVSSGCSLIVVGGEDGHNTLATVEVLDMETRQWSIASSLTHTFSSASISICSERLYMLGGEDQTHSVLSCSIPELLQSCQPQPLVGKLQTAPANQLTIWQRVADAPHYFSCCATLCGQLVAVGGRGTHEETGTITVYNARTDSWETIGDMPTARCRILVAILNGKMMAVGGCIRGWVRGLWTETNAVEIMC